MICTMSASPWLMQSRLASLLRQFGVFVGGGALRRHKRGRPDTWLYRHLQWWIALRHPAFAPYTGGRSLVTRSGCWTARRSAP